MPDIDDVIGGGHAAEPLDLCGIVFSGTPSEELEHRRELIDGGNDRAVLWRRRIDIVRGAPSGKRSGVAPAGAVPDALSPMVRPVEESWNSRKQSPPIDVACPSTVVSTAETATMASTTWPPRFSTAIAARLAAELPDTTMARPLKIGARGARIAAE